MSDGQAAPHATLATLEALLDTVHAALLSGDLAALPALASRIEALAGGPVPEGPVPAALQAKAQRNRACLAAAARGLEAARRRLREIAGAAAGGSVYDGAGRPRRMTAAPGRIATRL